MAPPGPPSPESPFPDPDRLLADLRFFGVRLGLDTCRNLLDALGSPQKTVPAVLVAGTNGKGSTAALLASMATAAGYRTALYTSPHLETVEERIRLDGAAIPRQTLGRILAEILSVAKRLSREPITYFEALTVAAFVFFAREKVDLAFLEVGLGGRLDATNVGEPILSVVCPISLDHQEHLGDDLEQIAREKAGILRPGVPAVAWMGDGDALHVIQRTAIELGAPLRLAAEQTRWKDRRSLGWEGQKLRLETPTQVLEMTLRLLGEHQLANLSLAVTAAESLREKGYPRLFGEALEEGVASCRWPGRLEAVELPGNRRILLDAAHNADAARRLRCFLDTVDEDLHLLFGVLAEKDYGLILEALAPRFRRITLTRPESPRSHSPESLRKLLEDTRWVAVEDSLEAALDGALVALAGSECQTLVICGSIFLVGPVRSLLRQRFGVPLPAAEILTGPEPKTGHDRYTSGP